MIFSLDVRRARKGDCLLIHSGTETEPGLVMIDGGPSSVYLPQLKPRIECIREARGLADADPLTVDVLMVSHVDDDHIRGLLELGKEESDKKQDQEPQSFNVQSFWHNSFDAIIDNNAEEITASMKGAFGEAAASGSAELSEAKKEEVVEASTEDGEVVESGLMVLANVAQGFQLRRYAEFLEWPPNPDFDGELIIARPDAEPIDVAPGLTFKVVGPMAAEVDALREEHVNWLKKLKEEGKSPPEALAAYIDTSVPNLSSLVIIAEAGKKRMLLTGDARGDKIIKGLEQAGELDDEKPMKVDILKVPHHGSANNLDDDFFERIIADHYVFSGDGEHGNPERESMEMLFKARGSDPFTIHLTYSIEAIDELREADWRSKQGSEKKRKAKAEVAAKAEKDEAKSKANAAKASEIKVRSDWFPEDHSLTAFFAGKKKKSMAKAKQTIEIVSDDPAKAHVIDLLDRLGY